MRSRCFFRFYFCLFLSFVRVTANFFIFAIFILCSLFLFFDVLFSWRTRSFLARFNFLFFVCAFLSLTFPYDCRRQFLTVSFLSSDARMLFLMRISSPIQLVRSSFQRTGFRRYFITSPNCF